MEYAIFSCGRTPSERSVSIRFNRQVPGPKLTRIRPAESNDVDAMREIERAAGRLFAEIGMEDIAAHDPFSVDELLQYIRGERAWVAEANSRVVGYILADLVDGSGHIEQVSVHPDHSRRGIGRGLIDAVIEWARAQRLPALTLLTFRDVAWNGPYYAKLGFRPLLDVELTPELRSLRAHERELGLDVDGRQAMRLDL